MSPLKPRTHLETHEVVNQPPPFEGVNLFTSDIGLSEAVRITMRNWTPTPSSPAPCRRCGSRAL